MTLPTAELELDVQEPVRFAIHAIAAGEVRDSAGNLVEQVHGEQTYEVDAAELRVFSDETLRTAGLTEEQIKQVRDEGEQT